VNECQSVNDGLVFVLWNAKSRLACDKHDIKQKYTLRRWVHSFTLQVLIQGSWPKVIIP